MSCLGLGSKLFVHILYPEAELNAYILRSQKRHTIDASRRSAALYG